MRKWGKAQRMHVRRNAATPAFPERIRFVETVSRIVKKQ